MLLSIPTSELLEADAGAQLQYPKQIFPASSVSPAAKSVIPKGNSRRHEKAVFKNNMVEHAVEYLYNPPKPVLEIEQADLKVVVLDIAKRLNLQGSIKNTCSIYSRSLTEIAFAFVAFELNDEMLLKLIPMFDKIMMTHGWDKLVLSIVNLDPSVTRVNFLMKTTAKKAAHKTIGDMPDNIPVKDVHNTEPTKNGPHITPKKHEPVPEPVAEEPKPVVPEDLVGDEDEDDIMKYLGFDDEDV